MCSLSHGRTNGLQHTIPTTTEYHIRQQARKIPPFWHEEEERDVIQPSTSPWALPIVLVLKKDDSIRFCVDYRKLNTITRKDAYPLLRIDDMLDTLAGSPWFTVLVLIHSVGGYWQVEVAEVDREKIAFTTYWNLRVMFFELCNVPATFQCLMDLVLTGVQWQQYHYRLGA